MPEKRFFEIAKNNVNELRAFETIYVPEQGCHRCNYVCKDGTLRLSMQWESEANFNSYRYLMQVVRKVFPNARVGKSKNYFEVV